MRRTAILEATKPPRRRLLLPGSRRQNVRPTRNGLGFMRKFGEYVFLEDSRYACQAKSARALPLGASARPDAAWVLASLWLLLVVVSAPVVILPLRGCGALTHAVFGVVHVIPAVPCADARALRAAR